MKSVLALMLLTFSMNSFATGGFYCNAVVKNNDVDVTIQISGTTARTFGNPLVANLNVGVDEVSDLQFEISKDLVVGYWNQDSLMIHTLDSNAEYSTILLKYDLENSKGTLDVNFQGIKGTSNEVTCELE